MAARIAASGTGVRAYVRSPERVEAIRARQVVCVRSDEMAARERSLPVPAEPPSKAIQWSPAAISGGPNIGGATFTFSYHYGRNGL
jgi:hypothetical protein